MPPLPPNGRSFNVFGDQIGRPWGRDQAGASNFCHFAEGVVFGVDADDGVAWNGRGGGAWYRAEHARSTLSFMRLSSAAAIQVGHALGPTLSDLKRSTIVASCASADCRADNACFLACLNFWYRFMSTPWRLSWTRFDLWDIVVYGGPVFHSGCSGYGTECCAIRTPRCQ